MLLACDIGNTRIKSALFNKDKSSNHKSALSLNDIIKANKNKNINSVIFSSVVAEKSEEFIKLVKKNFSITPYRINNNSKFNLTIDYLTPGTLGIDRICSAEGAFYLFRKSKKINNYNKDDFIISIDFGTATTLNFVKYPGIFIGGIILPGIEMMVESLKSQTAQLPKILTSNYKSLIGKNTKGAIASGVINSALGLIEKSVKELKQKYKAREIYIYITGGNSKKIIPYLNLKYKFIDDLVLIGVKTVYEKNIKPKL